MQGGTYSSHGDPNNACRNLVRKSFRKYLHGISRETWMDDMELNVKETDFEDGRWNGTDLGQWPLAAHCDSTVV
jgi:hypothetical protein